MDEKKLLRKREKKIVVNNPFLMRLRRNLRAILKEAYLAEIRRLRALDQLYVDKHDRFGKYTPSQWKRSCGLARKERELRLSYNESILNCGVAVSCKTEENESLDILDVDMVWVPTFGGWMCLPCFEYLTNRKQRERGFQLDIDRLLNRDGASQKDLKDSFEKSLHIAELLKKKMNEEFY